MNKWIGIGRLTKAPELRFLPTTGKALCKFTIAVNRPFKKDETDFIQCTAFDKKAEVITQYLDKGSQIAVTGQIRNGSYDGKDGNKIYTSEIYIEEFEFVGNNKKPDNSFDNDITPVNDVEAPF